eukprot:6121589-Amphidinium_carterae.1
MQSSVHRLLVSHTEALHQEVQIVGLVPTADGTLIMSHAARRFPDLWEALQELSLQEFGYPLVRAVMGHGVRKIPIHGSGKSVVICWVPGHADRHVEFEIAHGRQKLLDHMLGNMWAHYCWVEFILHDSGMDSAKSRVTSTPHDDEDDDDDNNDKALPTEAEVSQPVAPEPPMDVMAQAPIQRPTRRLRQKTPPPRSDERLVDVLDSQRMISSSSPSSSTLPLSTQQPSLRSMPKVAGETTGIPQLIPTRATPRVPSQMGQTPSRADQRKNHGPEMHVDECGPTRDEQYRLEQIIMRSASSREEQRQQAQSQLDQLLRLQGLRATATSSVAAVGERLNAGGQDRGRTLERNDINMRDTQQERDLADRSRSRDPVTEHTLGDERRADRSRSRDGNRHHPRDDASRSRDGDEVRQHPRDDASRSRDGESRPASAASRSRDSDSTLFALEAQAMQIDTLEDCMKCVYGLASVKAAADTAEATAADEDPGAEKASALSAADVKCHWAEVEKGVLKELDSWMEHHVLEKIPVSQAANVIDTTWVYRWKGDAVKARWCIRGFKDRQKDALVTSAFTASRMSQRVITSLAALNQWPMISLDISTAFLQGDSYEDKEHRMICIKIPAWLLVYLQRYEQFQDYNPRIHAVRLRKPAYGLVDAPRRWYAVLRKELETAGWQVALSEPGLFFLRTADSRLPQGYLTVHADDLKLTAPDPVLQRLESQLTKKFGKLKHEKDRFEHCGVMHEVERSASSSGVTYVMHQNQYLKRVQLPDTSRMKEFRTNAIEKCSERDHAIYRSLLGKVAWCVTTRPEAAVVSALLQSRANSPVYEDLIRLIILAKWLKQNPSVTRYGPMAGPYRLVLASDASFKPEEQERSARRGEVCMLMPSSGSTLGGPCHLLHFASKRIGRVTKSTYAAELHSLAYSSDVAHLLSMQFEQFTNKSWSLNYGDFDLLCKGENQTVPVEAVTDSKSVFDSLRSADDKVPEEQPLVLVLRRLREMLHTGILVKVWWTATGDMVADGLSKSTVKREGLLELCSTGRWLVKTRPQCFRRDLVSVSEFRERQRAKHE